MNYDAIGGRRWVFTLLAFCTASVLLWFGKLTGEQWVSLVPMLAGIYVAGNVGQRAVESRQLSSGA